MKSKTLLTVPDLAAAIEPLVGRPISEMELFRLIASGDVEPLDIAEGLHVSFG